MSTPLDFDSVLDYVLENLQTNLSDALECVSSFLLASVNNTDDVCRISTQIVAMSDRDSLISYILVNKSPLNRFLLAALKSIDADGYAEAVQNLTDRGMKVSHISELKRQVKGLDSRFAASAAAATDNIDSDWPIKLVRTSKGVVVSNHANVLTCIENDPVLHKSFRVNVRNSRSPLVCVVNLSPDSLGALCNDPEAVILSDERNCSEQDLINYWVRYCSFRFGIEANAREAVTFARCLESEATQVLLGKSHTLSALDPISNYLQSLPSWDGIERIGDLLSDIFGLDRNIRHAEMMKKTLVGAVRRAGLRADGSIKPYLPYKDAKNEWLFTKHDNVLVLLGDQGTSKNKFVTMLGSAAAEFHPNAAGTLGAGDLNVGDRMAKLNDSWVVFNDEIVCADRQSEEAFKAFVSMEPGSHRLAHRGTQTALMARGVIIASSNEAQIVNDRSGTGARRFWITSHICKSKVNNKLLDQYLASPELVNQLWAEAVALSNAGYRNYLHPELDSGLEAIFRDKEMDCLYRDDAADQLLHDYFVAVYVANAGNPLVSDKISTDSFWRATTTSITEWAVTNRPGSKSNAQQLKNQSRRNSADWVYCDEPRRCYHLNSELAVRCSANKVFAQKQARNTVMPTDKKLVEIIEEARQLLELTESQIGSVRIHNGLVSTRN